MRRHDRAVTELSELKAIIAEAKICRLGLVENGLAYIVPLNFGHEWAAELPRLFFHCAPTGRKLELLRQQPQVGFELDCRQELLPGDRACDYGYAYASIIGQGCISELREPAAKRHALDAIMRQVAGPGAYNYSQAQLEHVCVLCLAVTELSAKQRRAEKT